MRFASVCSGIEAASCAWEPLGFKAAFFSEVAAFPSRFLAHRYPAVPNLGDLNGLAKRVEADGVDLLVGGTPCQSFSVSGLRRGLADARGNLALEFAQLAAVLRPRWVVWENVPGVLSQHGGRDFASIVGALVELGYGCAWRVLDAQFYGVPQRRRRVFLVGCLGNAAGAGAVLFEPEGRRWDSEPRRPSLEDVAPTLRSSSPGRGGRGAKVNGTDRAALVAEAFNAEGSEGFTLTASALSKTVNNQTPLLCFDETQITHPENRSNAAGDTAPSLARGARPPIAYAIAPGGTSGELTATEVDVAPALTANLSKQNDRGTRIVESWKVRRLTPLECERLQSFPDNWTKIPKASDSARYAALGNTMNVEVMRWLGRRIQTVDGLIGADVP